MTLTTPRPWVYGVLTVIPAAPIVLLAAAEPSYDPAIRTLVGVLWVAWIAIFGSLYLRRLDETARSAQRWAWEWGGALGLGAAVMAALFGWYLFPGLAEAFGKFVAERSDHPAATGFAYGAGFAAIIAITGWFIALAVWWFPKREVGQ